MPQCNLAVKDINTGLWLKTYSTNLENCVFHATDYMCCDAMSAPEFQAILDNMNSQSGGGEEPQFIGQNPPPR